MQDWLDVGGKTQIIATRFEAMLQDKLHVYLLTVFSTFSSVRLIRKVLRSVCCLAFTSKSYVINLFKFRTSESKLIYKDTVLNRRQLNVMHCRRKDY